MSYIGTANICCWKQTFIQMNCQFTFKEDISVIVYYFTKVVSWKNIVCYFDSLMAYISESFEFILCIFVFNVSNSWAWNAHFFRNVTFTFSFPLKISYSFFIYYLVTYSMWTSIWKLVFLLLLYLLVWK